MFLLHAHGTEAAEGFWSEVFVDGLLDTLKLIPFLFVTYLLMEYIEHKAKSRAEGFIQRSGALAPVVGGLVGAVPQCGFSSAAANLYSGRLITLGTLIAVFLSTSDEMIPILISGKISALAILAIVAYKTVAAIAVGLLIDLFLRKKHDANAEIHSEEICHAHDHCHGKILPMALGHTAKISLFVLIINLSINALIYLVGEDTLGTYLSAIPVLSHLLGAVFGLIPNCAASVALTTLAIEGLISSGTMISGLFSGAGIGLAVLLKENKSKKENLAVILIIVVFGTIFGILSDIIMPDILTI